ncbi:hypothetical protein F5Y13DRAFT_195059 [Hypoxylon sp. FL1857]|nr:hypothetical protein F5Y13DRAFT_195059 [Hypoxylon sp. FL1857]
MRKNSRKKKAVVDYRHRWPTQQTLYESREFSEGELGKPKSRRVKQDDIDHHMELIESRKQKRPSTSTLFEYPQATRSTTAKTKPGKSTHPYDTGVGETTARDVEDNTEQELPSRRTQQATTSRRQTPREPSRPRKTKRVESSPSLARDGTLAPTPRKNNGSNGTTESQAAEGHQNQNKIKFRSVLGLSRNRGETPNTSHSEVPSISPIQLETEAERLVETRPRRWWYFKKRRRTQNQRTRNLSSSLAEEASMRGEESDGLAALEGSRSTWKSIKTRRAHQRPETEVATNMYDNRTEDAQMKTGKGTSQKQKVDNGSEKTGNGMYHQKPDRGLSRESRPTLQIRRRKTISSSQARPSTTGTSSTPGTTTVHRDVGHEDSRETPSPISPTQVLRLLLGPRKTPPSRPATQPDLGGRGGVDSILGITAAATRAPTARSRRYYHKTGGLSRAKSERTSKPEAVFGQGLAEEVEKWIDVPRVIPGIVKITYGENSSYRFEVDD